MFSPKFQNKETFLAYYTPDRVELLQAAFNRVCNRTDWKLPIKATVPVDERFRVAEAIEYFTGSIPVLSYIGNGNFEVEAAGYYAATGA